MTASTYANIAQTVLNLIRVAVEQGLTASNPVKILLKGSTIQGDLVCPQRNVIISFAQPEVTAEVQLWINPANRLMFKSNPSTQTWQQIFEYADIFSAYNIVGGGTDGTIGGGTAGQPVQSLTDLQALSSNALSDKTLIYVENERAIYAYDADSIDAGEGIIVPNDGVGRWVLVSNTSGSVLNLDGGLFN